MVGLAAVGMASTSEAVVRSGMLFFLMSYAVTNLGAFFAIIAITNKINSDEISDFSGMIKRAPVLSVALSFCLISLIGLPPTGGLIAKIYIFQRCCTARLAVAGYCRGDKQLYLGFLLSKDRESGVGGNTCFRGKSAVIMGSENCRLVLPAGCIDGHYSRRFYRDSRIGSKDF